MFLFLSPQSKFSTHQYRFSRNNLKLLFNSYVIKSNAKLCSKILGMVLEWLLLAAELTAEKSYVEM